MNKAIMNKAAIYATWAGICLFGAGTVSHAQMYKWVDEDGVTQYTQQPPPGNIPAESLQVRVAPADEAALNKLESQLNQADQLRENRLKAAEESRLVAEEKAIKEENCRRSRARLNSYSIPNALIAQPDGSRLRVDEQTRQRELATSREMIEKYCN